MDLFPLTCGCRANHDIFPNDLFQSSQSKPKIIHVSQQILRQRQKRIVSAVVSQTPLPQVEQRERNFTVISLPGGEVKVTVLLICEAARVDWPLTVIRRTKIWQAKSDRLCSMLKLSKFTLISEFAPDKRCAC